MYGALTIQHYVIIRSFRINVPLNVNRCSIMLRQQRNGAYAVLQSDIPRPHFLFASSCKASNANKSLTSCKWVGICSNAADEREDENTSADNTDPDTAVACRSTAGNMSYKSLHL